MFLGNLGYFASPAVIQMNHAKIHPTTIRHPLRPC